MGWCTGQEYDCWGFLSEVSGLWICESRERPKGRGDGEEGVTEES